MLGSPVGLPNRELVVYALYVLDGASRWVHTEDVAVKCHELFPDSFSWTRYTEYPDKDIVRVALTDARKSQHGAMVHGRSGRKRYSSAETKREAVDDGWMLTESGLHWVLQHQSLIGEYVADHAAKVHRQKVRREMQRIRTHALFERFSENPDQFTAMIGEIADLLRCRVDAEPETWSARFNTLRRQAETADESEVLDFIARCQRAVASQS